MKNTSRKGFVAVVSAGLVATLTAVALAAGPPAKVMIKRGDAKGIIKPPAPKTCAAANGDAIIDILGATGAAKVTSSDAQLNGKVLHAKANIDIDSTKGFADIVAAATLVDPKTHVVIARGTLRGVLTAISVTGFQGPVQVYLTPVKPGRWGYILDGELTSNQLASGAIAFHLVFGASNSYTQNMLSVRDRFVYCP